MAAQQCVLEDRQDNALDEWESAPFSGIFYNRTESCSQSFIHACPPASKPLKLSKKSLFKNNFWKVGEKCWKVHDFRSLTPHYGKKLLVFEPVVGDFYEHISNQGFFDSLVRQILDTGFTVVKISALLKVFWGTLAYLGNKRIEKWIRKNHAQWLRKEFESWNGNTDSWLLAPKDGSISNFPTNASTSWMGWHVNKHAT